MIKITEGNIHSMVASYNNSSEEEYTERAWGLMEDQNPVFIRFIIEQLQRLSDEEKGAFLEGVLFCYETIRRQIEADEMS